MRAIDTNLLVRLIVRDNLAQVHAAEAFIGKSAWVSHLVLAETIWVLDAVYGLSHKKLVTAIDMLLNHKSLAIQDTEVAAKALEHYRERPSVGFSDCLIVEIAHKAGHRPVGTFDQNFLKLKGTEKPHA